MRQVCALLSTLQGGVATRNSELPGQTPITVTYSSALRQWVSTFDGMRGAAYEMTVARVGGLRIMSRTPNTIDEPGWLCGCDVLQKDVMMEHDEPC